MKVIMANKLKLDYDVNAKGESFGRQPLADAFREANPELMNVPNNIVDGGRTCYKRLFHPRHDGYWCSDSRSRSCWWIDGNLRDADGFRDHEMTLRLGTGADAPRVYLGHAGGLRHREFDYIAKFRANEEKRFGVKLILGGGERSWRSDRQVLYVIVAEEHSHRINLDYAIPNVDCEHQGVLHIHTTECQA